MCVINENGVCFLAGDRGAPECIWTPFPGLGIRLSHILGTQLQGERMYLESLHLLPELVQQLVWNYVCMFTFHPFVLA